MPTYRLRVWTGPTLVRDVSRRMKLAKLKVRVTGTEHVTVDVRATHQNGCGGAWHNLSAALYQKFGTDYGIGRRPERFRDECRLLASSGEPTYTGVLGRR